MVENKRITPLKHEDKKKSEKSMKHQSAHVDVNVLFGRKRECSAAGVVN